jgi:hypothetical protein
MGPFLKAPQEGEEFMLAATGALGLEEVLRAIRSLQGQVAGRTRP